jgi:hypothetical protein
MEDTKYCVGCGETRPHYHFYFRQEDGFSRDCRFCISETKKVRYHSDPAYRLRMRKINVAWGQKNKEWRRFNHILNTYKITVDQYAALEESQDFHCAICPSESELHVDHNHKTGKVRGLLCMSCNMGLGNFMDSEVKMQNACAYLQKKGSYA